VVRTGLLRTELVLRVRVGVSSASEVTTLRRYTNLFIIIIIIIIITAII